MKKQFVDQVISEMSFVLEPEQIRRLEAVLFRQLSEVDIVRQERTLICCENDNERYLRQFVASKRLEGTSEATINKYVFYARLLFQFLNKSFRDVSTTDIQFFLSEYELTHDICKRTLENMRKGINGFFSWLFDMEYIKMNPVKKIKPIAYEKKAVEILTDEEILDIRDCVHNDVRARAIIETLLATGVRVSELLNIQIDDLDLDNNEITIHCAKKRRKQDRILFLTAEAKKGINEYMRYRLKRGYMDSSYLFVANKKNGKPLTERLVNEGLKKISDKCGLKKKLTVHTFRKTLASILYRRGMQPLDIAYILGHADSRMSETYYIGIKNEDVKRGYAKFR